MQISLSLLETGIRNFRFLFSSRNLRFFSKFLFLLSKPENRKSHSLSLLESGEPFYKFLFLFSKVGKGISEFSFSSPNWRKEFQISLSLLDWTFWPLVNACAESPQPLPPWHHAHSKAINGLDGLNWILLGKLVLLEHLPVKI